MAKRDANINISGDTTDAQQSIQDLENFTKKSFNKMSDAAQKESKEVSDAFKKSGIRMEKDIKKSSADARKNYQKIKNSGTASANDIKRAHIAMTKKIKANNRELNTSSNLVSKAFKGLRANLLGITLAAAGAAIAIKKAFDFAGNAAKLQAQRTAFNNFTSAMGEDADELLKKLTEVSKGTVAQSSLISSAGKALLLGLDPTKIVKLLEVARASSKITGEELTTQFNDIAIGTGRASRLILDNLGIMFSQAEATRRAAIEFGVLESELTDNQKAQGNLNEVIRQGQVIIQNVGKDYTSQADVLAKLKARYIDITVVIGQKLLKALPKVEIAVLKVSKAFLQFFKVLSQGNKINSRFLDFMGVTTDSTSRAQHGIDNLTRAIEFMDKRIESATDATKEFNQAEETSVTNSAKLIKRSKERQDFLQKEEKLIADNLKVKLAAIEEGNTAQKAQNDLLKKSITETKQELRELEAEVKRAADFNQTILDEIAESQKRRDQAGFDPLEKLVDDLKRAEEQFEQASEERTAGNVERARELTLSAVQAANAILEVGKGADKESEVSTQELSKAQFEAGKLVQHAKDFAVEMQSAAEDAIPAVEEKIINMENALKVGKETLKGVKDAIAEATREAGALKAKLSEDTTATHTQVINTVNAGGTSAPGMDTGGAIPGYGGGDRRLRLLEDGEHVIRKESVRKIGREAAEAFNAGDVAGLISSLPVQGMNQGGEVKGESATKSVNVNMELGGGSYPMQATESVANAFVREIEIINITRGRKKVIY